ncbi:MAG: outer membrane beta-barrel protein [Bacteroidia bacterium]
MKKYLFMTVLVSALSLNSNAQCVKQGDVLVDAYYGFPNLFKSILQADANNIQNSTGGAVAGGLTIYGIGPMGAKAEYLLTDKFGMGIDFNYSNVGVKFSNATTNSNGNPVTYNYNLSSPAIRAMLGFNFHFVRTDKIDVYGAVKAGYYNRSFGMVTNDPNYHLNLSLGDPLAFRLEIGMRYFITENIGVHVNLGFPGGPLVAAGVAFKFGTVK